jgi:membrane protease YdiL (CAAX protease family)
LTTIAVAVVTGVGVLLAGSLPWGVFARIAGLGSSDPTAGSAVPWVILPMALYLGGYWWVIRGPRLRANRLPPGLWLPSLVAGLAGFAALLALLSLAARLVQLPAGPPIVTPPQMPVVTVVLLLTMQSIVAGVTEEAAFRGYMQSMIESQHGVLIAILVNGLLFGLLHFPSHPGDVVLMLPYYVAVAAVYGGLTWAADSILPALVLHSAGDVVVLTRWWATGLPEWQLTTSAPPLVWERGVDASFVLTAIVLVVLAVVTFWAYRRIHDLRLARQVSQPLVASV